MNLTGTTTQREEIRPSQVRVPSPVPPPPPSCWGENRARFSDVVARNPENISPAFCNSGKTTKNHDISQESSSNISRRNKSSDGAERLSIQETCPSPVEYSEVVPITATSTRPCAVPMEQETTFNAETLIMPQAHSQSNSYFINTFADQPVSSYA